MTTPQQGGARNRRRCNGEVDSTGDPDADVDVDRLIESDAFWKDVLDDASPDDVGDDDAIDD